MMGSQPTLGEQYHAARKRVKQAKGSLDEAVKEMQAIANKLGEEVTAKGVFTGELIQIGVDGPVYRVKWMNGQAELEPIKMTVV